MTRKTTYTSNKLAIAMLIGGYFLTQNIMEIAILQYCLKNIGASGIGFAISFYTWKNSSTLMQFISKIGLVLGPIFLLSSMKEGVWDFFVQKKEATLKRHIVDFIQFLCLVAFAAISYIAGTYEHSVYISDAIHTLENPETQLEFVSSLKGLLHIQEIALFLNVFSAVLPYFKFSFDKEKEKQE